MSNERFAIIEVGCLECNSGDSRAEVVGTFSTQEEATTELRDWAKKHRSPDADRFIFDNKTARIIAFRDGQIVGADK